MKKIGIFRQISSPALIAGFLIGMSLMNPLGFAAETAILCHKDVPDSALSKGEVEDIFLGRKTRWTNETPIHFVILRGGEVHESFLREYIGKTDSQFTMFWKKMVFTGKGRLPTAFETPEELMAHVAATPGAVGYAPTRAVKDTVKKVSIH